MKLEHARDWIVCLALCVLSSVAAAEDLVIPGSGNPEFVLRQLADAFNRQNKEHRVTVPPSTGTAGAIRDVEAGVASIGRVGRPLKAEERAKGLSYLPLGREPIVFVAGAGVDVRGLTSAQVVDIYTGKLTDWRDLGGKSGPIRAIGREVTDASRQAIGKQIKAFESMIFPDTVKLVHLDPQMIELLDRFPTSFGFLNRSALGACKTKVIIMDFEGVEPNAENVESGRYPIAFEFGLIYRPGALTPGGKAFLEFLQSGGQRLLREHGVLPISAR